MIKHGSKLGAGAVVLMAIFAALVVRRERVASAAAPLDDYSVVYGVLVSPRCRNCHPSGNAPLQGDEGRPHAQNVTRRSVANGLLCSTCHRESNGRLAHAPPGAPHWGLPPSETPMVFQGRTPRELCEQIKDPMQTHGKDLPALIEHVERDPLVLWGWSPGPGRTTPPTAHDRFVGAFRAWVGAGAPCP